MTGNIIGSGAQPDTTEENFDEIKTSLSDIDGKVDTVDGKVDTVDGKVDTVDGKVDTVDGKVDTVDGKVDGLIVDVANIDTCVDGSSDKIGDFDDLVSVPFDVSDLNTLFAYLKTGYYHVHGAAFLHPDKADPVQLTSSAASWSETGTIQEVIPAGAITKPFDLHWCSIWDISSSLYGVIDIFAGPVESPVKIGSVDVGRTANFSREMTLPVQVPQLPANTRISCRFSDSTTTPRTVRVKFYGHVYSTSLT